jgi:hypothetical protein
MRIVERIEARLAGMDRRQLALVAAACAEHTAPIIRHLGTAETQDACQRYRAQLWAAAGRDGTGPDHESALAALHQLPELAEDDDDEDGDGAEEEKVPHFEIWKALDVMIGALTVCGSDDPLNVARSVCLETCTDALEIYGGCDFFLYTDGKPRPFDLDDPPPPGPLEAHEIEAQMALLNQVAATAAVSSQELVDRVREEAHQSAAKLDALMPEYIVRSGRNPR